MPNVTGSIRKVTLDGVTFEAFSSANFKETGSQYMNEAIATSGENLRKVTKRPDVVEGVELKVNGEERDYLVSLNERLDDFPMSYETANGDVRRCTGWIEFESRETEDSKATVKMFPRNRWEEFLAA
jgi:hypothetical protein